ncbi:MAG: single-stranded DNA-binding protein, partial [Candidatus Bathyarchaeota archaeon]
MSYEQKPVKSKVESLTPSSRRVDVTVKIVSKNPVRDVVSKNDGSAHRVTEAVAGDETGVVLLTLWDNDIERVTEGNVFNVNNGYITLFKGSMRLNVGKYGSLEPSQETIGTVKTDNNISEKQFEDDRRRGGFRR